ncbi:MAG: hypothetical protein ACR2QF_00665 [Geminicoccaceae bacterium]
MKQQNPSAQKMKNVDSQIECFFKLVPEDQRFRSLAGSLLYRMTAFIGANTNPASSATVSAEVSCPNPLVDAGVVAGRLPRLLMKAGVGACV